MMQCVAENLGFVTICKVFETTHVIIDSLGDQEQRYRAYGNFWINP